MGEIIFTTFVVWPEKKIEQKFRERDREKLCAYHIPEYNEFVSNQQSLKDCLLLLPDKLVNI